jgi:hypothetical protein
LQILLEKNDELLENDVSAAAVPEAVKVVVEPLPVGDDKTDDKGGDVVTVDLGSSSSNRPRLLVNECTKTCCAFVALHRVVLVLLCCSNQFFLSLVGVKHTALHCSSCDPEIFP